MRGQHIIIEGVDGSGKSTVIAACRAWAEARQHRCFDVVAFSQQEKRLPHLSDIGDASTLLCAEPTFAWIGSAIREEMIRKQDTIFTVPYNGAETAEAFALDRLVQFRRLIIPFLEHHPNHLVIQDRSLASSLAYQPLQDPTLTTAQLLRYPGNEQTLSFPPTLLLLICTEATIAQARLEHRTEKQDGDIFNESSFQARLVARFLSDDVLGHFRDAGTRIAFVDGNQDKARVAQAVTDALTQHLGSL